MLLCLELVSNEVLQGLGLVGSFELAVTDFLRNQVRRLGGNKGIGGGYRRTVMLPIMSFLTGLNAAEPSTSAET